MFRCIDDSESEMGDDVVGRVEREGEAHMYMYVGVDEG